MKDLKALASIYHAACTKIVNKDLEGTGICFIDVPKDELETFNRDKNEWVRNNIKEDIV